MFPDDEDQQWLVIPEQAWRARQEHWAPHRAPVAFCLEASLDRTEWTVAVAARRNDGLRQAQLAHLQSGSSGLVDWLVERQRKWRACALVVDAGGPAGTLIADLEAAGLEILKPAVREYAAACGSFADGIAGAVEPGQDRDRVQDVRCTDQEQLTAAVAGLSLRKVAELNVFERAGLGFRASAIALALWGLARKGPAHYDPLKSVLVAEVGW